MSEGVRLLPSHPVCLQHGRVYVYDRICHVFFDAMAYFFCVLVAYFFMFWRTF